MKITVVCSDPQHPKWPRLVEWVERRPAGTAALLTRAAEAPGGDILFLISCSEIVRRDVRDRYRHTLVIHPSALPQGRGWSPQVWTVLEGSDRICVTLLEAADKVDAGAIWAQCELHLDGHELWDEIADRIADAERELMDFAIANTATVTPREQDHSRATYYRRRTPADSELDITRSIADQFDLLRVCDPNRYPAFFEFRGHRYAVRLTKVGQKDGAP